MIRPLALLLGAMLFAACGSGTRKPVSPPGSGEPDMPWNPPMPGEGQGAMGGILERQ